MMWARSSCIPRKRDMSTNNSTHLCPTSGDEVHNQVLRALVLDRNGQLRYRRAPADEARL